jgi:hypothetical protein
MVTSPVALIVAPVGAVPGIDQVTVCGGAFVPITAAENCRVALPEVGRTRNPVGEGVTLTCVTPAVAVAEIVIVALPQTVGTAVEHAVGETTPGPTAVSTPVALMVATVAGVPAGNDQVTVVATPASALTAADIGSVAPTAIVTPVGATLMLWTVGVG